MTESLEERAHDFGALAGLVSTTKLTAKYGTLAALAGATAYFGVKGEAEITALFGGCGLFYLALTYNPTITLPEFKTLN